MTDGDLTIRVKKLTRGKIGVIYRNLYEYMERQDEGEQHGGSAMAV
jgi:hypothetical protein